MPNTVFGYRDGNTYSKALLKANKQVGLTMKDVMVLSPQAEPFWIGQPAQHVKARYFMDIYNAFIRHLSESGRDGEPVHIRQIHYWVLSGGFTKYNSNEPYENIEKCWNDLKDGAKFARILGYLPPDALTDERNPPMQPYAEEDPPHYSALHDPINEWGPALTVENTSVTLPELQAFNYGGTVQNAQPYHIEIWCEKSTMDDILMPICERYGIDYVPSIGYNSITNIVKALRRLLSQKKPSRILYISDFDPAGDNMPRQVSRQIEFWGHYYARDGASATVLPVKLMPVVLTKEQVEEYKLPPTPLKEGVKGGDVWTAENGGGVELDALQALHPGEIRRIVTEVVEALMDPDLEDKYEEYRKAVDDVVDKWEEDRKDFQERIDALSSEADDALPQDVIEELQKKVDDAMAPYLEQINDIIVDAKQSLAGYEKSINRMESPDANEPDDSDTTWLFDSARSYVDQLNAYHRQRNR